MDYPKLRSIDVFPCESSGQKVIGLRDPSRLDDKVLLVSYPVFFVMSLFDGTRSLLDIKTEYMRKFGEILYAERLEEIIHYLDDHYLLENERFAILSPETRRRIHHGASAQSSVCRNRV